MLREAGRKERVIAYKKENKTKGRSVAVSVCGVQCQT